MTQLPKDWKIVYLVDVAAKAPNSIVDGPFGSNLKLTDYVADGVPVLQGNNITGNQFQWANIRFISESKARSLKRSLVRVGDILIIKIGSIGYSAMIDDLKGYQYALIPANLCKVTPDINCIDPNYLTYYLTSNESVEYLVRNASATSQPALGLTKIKELPVPLPPFLEQKRIAALLSKAYRLRCLLRYAREISDTYLQSVFMGTFGDLRVNSSKYEMTPLGKICDVRDGTHESPSYVEKGYPLVTSKNLVNGYVDLNDVNFISEQDYIQINKRSKVDKGDILMPMIGTIGNPVLIDHIPNYAIKNVALIKFVPSSPSSKYIRELLHSYYFDFITLKSSRGGTQQFIALDDIRNFPIPLPSDEELNKFDIIVQKFERIQSQQREAERQVEHLLQTLLYKAFRGQLTAQ